MISRPWTWLTGTAVLFAGLTNAHSHVHFCFDGHAPAAAVHHVDTLQHSHDVPGARSDAHDDHHNDRHEHDEDAQHEDLDLDVPNDALAKTFKHDLPAVTPEPLRLAGFEPRMGSTPAHNPDIAPAPNPFWLRPPLRGPPR